MKFPKKAGSTSEIWQLWIADSSSTTGGGLTGLTNASSGLVAYYHRDTDTTATAITLASMTVGTFTSSGFKEIDATNMPGWYQFCPPNAALASGAKSVAIHLKGATNMAPLPIEVQLTAVDADDATAFGLSRIDAAVSSRMATFTQPTGFLAATFPGTVASTTNITAATGITLAGVTHTGAVIPTVSAVTGLTASNLDTTISSRMASYTQPTGFLAATFPTTVGSSTYAGGAVASVTGNVGGNVVGSVASVTGAVGSVTGNVGGNVVGSVASVTAGVTVTTNNDKTAYTLTTTPAVAGDAMTLTVAERAAVADKLLGRNQKGGSDGPAAQSVSAAIAGGLMSLSISGSTLTVKHADGTTAFTRTLSRLALDAIVNSV